VVEVRDAAAFFVAGGTLASDTPSYVERDVDRTLHENLLAGRFCYVLNSRQMGKSSLCVRTQAKLKDQGVICAFVDISRIGSRNVVPEQWYAGLAIEIGRSMGLGKELIAYWKDHQEVGPLQRLFSSLRDVVLNATDGAVVVMIDEIDATRSLPFDVDEFFAAIRDCHNQRTQDPAYNRLTFCLIGAAVPSDLIRNPRITAFNVGERIHLRDFTIQELRPFGAGLGTRAPLVERVHYWTNGQPFLTQSICLAIANDPSIKAPGDVDTFVRREFLSPEARETNVNLADVGKRILNSPEEGEDLAGYRSKILTAYAGILRDKLNVRDDESNHVAAVLKLSGIVRVENSFLKPRNRIYAQAFGLEWIRENMPGEETRRQAAAYRQGLFRAGFGGAIVTIALLLLSIAAIRSRFRADFESHQSRIHLQEALENAKQAKDSELLARTAEKSAKRLAEQRDAAYQSLKVTEASEKQAREAAETQASLAVAAEKRSIQDKQSAQKSAQLAKRSELLADTRLVEATVSSHKSYIANLTVAASALDSNEPEVANSILANLRGSPYLTNAYGFLRRFADNGVRVLHGHSDSITNIRFTPDGRYVVASSMDGSVIIWRVSDSKLIRTIKPGVPSAWCEAVSPDGSELIVGSRSKTLDAFDIGSGRRLWHHNTVSNSNWLVFAKDGKTVAAGDSDGWIRCFNPRDASLLYSFKDGATQVASLSFSPDGSELISASNTGFVRIHVLPSGKLLRQFATRDQLESVAWSPDGAQVATAGSAGRMWVWDPKSGAQLWTYDNPGLVNAVSATTQGLWLCSCQDGSNTILNRDGTKLKVFGGHTRLPSLDGVFSSDGRFVAAGQGSDVLVWPATEQSNYRETLELGIDFLMDVAISADGSRIAAADDRGEVIVSDRARGVVLRKIALPLQPIFAAVDLSPDGKLVAACTAAEGKAHVYEVASGRQVLVTPGASPVRFAPDGRTFVTGMANGELHVVDLASGRIVHTMKAGLQYVGRVSFSPDSKLLVSCCDDGTAELWDYAKGKLVHSYESLAGSMFANAFSPDGRLFAIGGGNGQVYLYDRSGDLLESYPAGSDVVHALVFTRDSKALVSAIDGDPLLFWDVASDSQIFALPNPTSPNRQIITAPDGTLLLAGNAGYVYSLSSMGKQDEVRLAERESNEAEAEKATTAQRTALIVSAAGLRRLRLANEDLLNKLESAEMDHRWSDAAALDSAMYQAMHQDTDYLLARARNELCDAKFDRARADALKLTSSPETRKDALLILILCSYLLHDQKTMVATLDRYLHEYQFLELSGDILYGSLGAGYQLAGTPLGEECAELAQVDGSPAAILAAIWDFAHGDYQASFDLIKPYTGNISLEQFASDLRNATVLSILLYIAAADEHRLGNESKAQQNLNLAESTFRRFSERGQLLWLNWQNKILIDIYREKALAEFKH